MESLKYYLRLGGKDAVIALLPAALLYLIIILRPRKKRELDKKEMLKWFLTLWYGGVLLLLVFLEGRIGTRMAPFRVALLHPFDVLRKVLISADQHELTLFILNILAFLPFGLILVWHAQSHKRGRRIYWLILLLPIIIELVQFATGLGTLEVDDWITNAIGGAWGVSLGECYVNRKAKRMALRWGTLALLPPLLFALGAGLWLARPYGFLRQDFADPAKPRPSAVSVEGLADLPGEELSVFRVREAGREAAPSIADRLFGALGLNRKTDRQDAYDDFTVYWAQDSNAYAWIYNSGDFMLTIPTELLAGDPRDEALLRLLEQAGFDLPAPGFIEEGRLAWDFVEADGCILDGEIRFRENAAGLLRIDYALRTLDAVMERPALDAASVRAALLRGRFSVSQGSVGETIGRIECDKAILVYAPDTKGFYRPLYAIDCRIDGTPAILLTPAC